MVTRTVRPRFKAPAEYQWTFTGPASVNEGETIDWVLSVDLNGVTPGAGEVINVSFQGQATPISPPAFATTIGQALTNAQRTGVVVGPNLNLLLYMDDWDKQPITISRVTNNIVAAQGNKTCSLEAFNFTKGVIVGSGVASVDIIDLPPPTPEGSELADFTVDTMVIRGDVETIYVLDGAAQGTIVGTLQEVTGDLESAEMVSGADAGGRFVIEGLQIKVGAVTPDWEPIQPPGAAESFPFYNISVRGHGPNASVIDKSYRIAAYQRAVRNASVNRAAVSNVTDLATLRTQIGSGPSDRRAKIAEVPAIYDTNGNAANALKRSQFTLEGYYRNICTKDRSIQIDQGTDVLLFNGTSKPGIQLPGAIYDDRDAFRISHAGLVCDTIVIRHWEFSQSTDELVSIISGAAQYARNILFEYCAFYEAAYEPSGSATPLHSEGAHDLGVLIYNGQKNVTIRKSFFSSSRQRHPVVSRAHQILVENCIIHYKGNSGGFGGTLVNSTKSTVENNAGITFIVRGNLYYPHSNGGARNRAWMMNGIGSGSYIHYVQAGDADGADYPNHFYDPREATRNWNDDPVTRASHVTYRNGATSASLIDFHPFKPRDDHASQSWDSGLMPTTTAAEREALWREVYNYAGARPLDANGVPIPRHVNKQLADCWAQNLLNGAARAMTKANIELWYGAGGDWNLGGTLGKINGHAELASI